MKQLKLKDSEYFLRIFIKNTDHIK